MSTRWESDPTRHISVCPGGVTKWFIEMLGAALLSSFGRELDQVQARNACSDLASRRRHKMMLLAMAVSASTCMAFESRASGAPLSSGRAGVYSTLFGLSENAAGHIAGCMPGVQMASLSVSSTPCTPSWVCRR